MRSWCEQHRKQPTRRRFINWLRPRSRRTYDRQPRPRTAPARRGAR
jgi:hypothetical protein